MFRALQNTVSDDIIQIVEKVNTVYPHYQKQQAVSQRINVTYLYLFNKNNQNPIDYRWNQAEYSTLNLKPNN